MGQYYRAVVIEENKVKGYFNPRECGSGTKLMDHSWVGNRFVKQVESYLLNNPQRLAWAGDYDDAECFYDQCEDTSNMLPKQDTDGLKDGRFIVNHTKKCAVRVPDEPGKECPFDEWLVHPLPLLTAMGNGKGGGDYWSMTEIDNVGAWATDVLEIAYEVPEGYEVKDIVFKV